MRNPDKPEKGHKITKYLSQNYGDLHFRFNFFNENFITQFD